MAARPRQLVAPARLVSRLVSFWPAFFGSACCSAGFNGVGGCDEEKKGILLADGFLQAARVEWLSRELSAVGARKRGRAGPGEMMAAKKKREVDGDGVGELQLWRQRKWARNLA